MSALLARCAAAALVVVGGWAAPAALQAQLSGELRLGSSLGAYEATGAGMERTPGFSGQLAATYMWRGGLGLQLGVGTSGFSCEGGFCVGHPVGFRSTGAEAGVRFEPAWRVAPWVTAGLAYHRLEATWGGWGDGSASASPGVALGGGLSLAMGQRLRLAPGLRYVRYTADMEGTQGLVDLFAAEVGLRVALQR
jgi:hypothetical protein